MRWVPSSIGAWSSPQSTVIGSRSELKGLVAATTARFSDVDDVSLPRPDFWGGYHVIPRSVEFWQGAGPSRLHDRVVYKRDGDGWTVQRLAP